MTELERLTKQYNKEVATLMKTCMDLELYNVLTGLLVPWLRHTRDIVSVSSSPSTSMDPLHGVVAGMLQFTLNLLNYSTSHGKKFRHHLALDSDIIAEVVLPYLALTVETTASAASASERGMFDNPRACCVLNSQLSGAAWLVECVSD